MFQVTTSDAAAVVVVVVVVVAGATAAAAILCSFSVSHVSLKGWSFRCLLDENFVVLQEHTLL